MADIKIQGIMKLADLFYQEGNSDKEYHIQLVSSGGMFRVECQWGRVGSTLQTQTKVRDVSLEQAEKVYTKVYKEKVGKGYKEGKKGGGLYTVASVVESGVNNGEEEGGSLVPVEGKRKVRWLEEEVMVPQLLNMIEEGDVKKYLQDDGYGAQEKKDGKHIMLRVKGGEVKAYNKKGKGVGYPSVWGGLQVSCVLDGEAIGEVYHVFDLLEISGEDLRGLGYGDRYKRLENFGGSCIKVVPLAIGYAAKKELYDKLVVGKKEGIVFKRLDAGYKPGRPASFGDMLKFKFYASASVRVCKGREGRHSIGMEVLDGGKWVFVGNCTVSQKADLPQIGCVVEIRYLNYRAGGSLYQPTFLGIRDDVDAEECVIGQLRHKAKEED